MKNKANKILSSFVVISLMAGAFSCYSQAVRKINPANIENIENRFFTLDFEKNRAEMADVETHFFTTFPHDDPTRGDIVYDRQKWTNQNMIKLEKGDGLYLFIKDRNDNRNYDSCRLTSKAYYNLNESTEKLLFVFKGKLPSAKGVWPAWWLNGSREEPWTYRDSGYVETDTGLDRYSGIGHFYDTPSAVNPTDWPAAGEIDIIETINGDNVIHNTIHTCPQMCDSEWNDNGQIINCANAKPGDPNSGCSGKPYQTDTPAGTFACLWEKNTIKFFYWKPAEDVRGKGGPLSKNPDPELWKTENLKNEVRFLETDSVCEDSLHQEWQCKNCDTSSTCVFQNMKMIFNITLCGKWAGNNFDNTENSLTNCQNYILGEGKEIIDNQFLKIEYVSVSKL